MPVLNIKIFQLQLINCNVARPYIKNYFKFYPNNIFHFVLKDYGVYSP